MLMLMRIKTDNKFNTKTMEKVCILLSCIDRQAQNSFTSRTFVSQSTNIAPTVVVVVVFFHGTLGVFINQ